MPQAYLILIISVFTTVGAQLCLKKGVLTLGELHFSLASIFSLIPRVLQNLWLIGGLFLFGISFLLWLLVLSKLQLNIAYPILVSLNFSFITLISWFLFKEYLGWLQVLGLGLIILGVFLLLIKG